MTVVFVAPDDSDDEDLFNCDIDDHLKYKIITDEIEYKRLYEQNNSSSNNIETIHRSNDSTMSNSNQGKYISKQTDATDTASIDSNQRYLINLVYLLYKLIYGIKFCFCRDGPSIIDRYLKHTKQYLPVKRTDSKE